MTNQLPEHPVMTVTGIRKSEGDFTGEQDKVTYSNTVVTVIYMTKLVAMKFEETKAQTQSK